MKPLALVLATFAPLILIAAPPQEKSSERKLTTFEKSLVGIWFTGGDPAKRSYIANSGSKLFTINEVKDALELVGSNDGALVASRSDFTLAGVVREDVILWANGTWWSRHPLPPPSDDLVIWNDPGSGWVTLKSAGKPVLEGDAQMHWDFDWGRQPRMGGKLYRNDQFLFAHAPSNLKFTFDKPITEFRSVVGLLEGGHLGSVVFKVKTDKGLVFTSEEMRQDRGNTQNVVLKFPPTKTLELITEQGGDNYEDWSNWLVPEVKWESSPAKADKKKP
jgi:hypothetical protein